MTLFPQLAHDPRYPLPAFRVLPCDHKVTKTLQVVWGHCPKCDRTV